MKRNPFLWMSLPVITALLLAWLFFIAATGTQASDPQLPGYNPKSAEGPTFPNAPPAECPTDLFFSEYIEGSSFNKAVEVYNGTGSDITFTSQYTLALYSNGAASPSKVLVLIGQVKAGDMHILAHPSADQAILDQADQTSSTVINFNGDDALALYKDGLLLDVIGVIGEDPGGYWGSTPNTTQDHTLVRKRSIVSGDTDGSDAFDPALEWDAFSSDTFDYLGWHLVTACGLARDLIVVKSGAKYTLPGAPIDYQISLENTASITATNIIVTDTLPVSVTYASDDSGVVPSNPSSGVFRWDLGELGPSITRSFNLTVTADAGLVGDTLLTNRITATVVLTGDTPYNNHANWQTRVAFPAAIHDIQGAQHLSPYQGKIVGVQGIVTALSGSGFYMQDVNPDSDDATSEGILVYTGAAPAVIIGDRVFVYAQVSEYYPGGYSTGNLSITELNEPEISLLSSGNSLPAATVIGSGGRIPPNTIIEDDATDVNVDGAFDPDEDGIDFYESLEGMLIQVNDAQVVGGTNNYGEIVIVGDSAANTGEMTARGGIVIQPDDFNPERIIIDDEIVASEPKVDVGVAFSAPISGVLDYNFGNYKLLNIAPLPPTSGELFPETVGFSATLASQLTVATFNVQNLYPGDAARFTLLARQIVLNLSAPDVIGLQEIQDNNGEINDGTVAADQTYLALIEAIVAAGGPTYQYRDIDPANNQDGGAPGANIRVGFLFRTDRGLSFVDRPGGSATTATTATSGANGVELTYNPGRIDPTNAAFFDSRKPLAGEFFFNGYKLFVIVNHFNSKDGDTPLFGRLQPPMLGSEVQRIQQAQVVNDFVDSILALDANALVVVLGDLNDFQFSPTLATLKGAVLTNLIDSLPVDERYTYIYDGNSQVLDHILVTHNIYAAGVIADVVHMNAEFDAATRLTDHDPVAAMFNIPLYKILLPLVCR